jgi:hypothetical protein
MRLAQARAVRPSRAGFFVGPSAFLSSWHTLLKLQHADLAHSPRAAHPRGAWGCPASALLLRRGAIFSNSYFRH